MSQARSITLLVVDEAGLARSFRDQTLDDLVTARPRGRVAAVCSAPIDGMVVDGSRPAAQALAAASPAGRRRVWDALIEDLSLASLWDAPATTLSEVFAAIAKVAHRDELAASRLDGRGDPAYPLDMLEAPGASGPISVGGKVGYVRWLDDPTLASAAAAAANQAASLPPGAFPTADPALWRDLLDSIAALLAAAAQPERALLASRD
jgi:hypothetical protein